MYRSLARPTLAVASNLTSLRTNLRRWQKRKVLTVTKIRLRTAFATRDGSPAMLLHDLRMLGFHAHTSREDEGQAPPGQQPFEIVILKIEDTGEEIVEDLIVSLLDTVSDWARVRFYQARADRERKAPKHIIIRGPHEETLARVTLKAEGRQRALLPLAA
jgi:hypothetical protein